MSLTIKNPRENREYTFEALLDTVNRTFTITVVGLVHGKYHF
jgi:hypothetical protein